MPLTDHERVLNALLNEMQRQHNDDTVTSPFTIQDRNGNSTPLDISLLATAAIAGMR